MSDQHFRLEAQSGREDKIQTLLDCLSKYKEHTINAQISQISGCEIPFPNEMDEMDIRISYEPETFEVEISAAMSVSYSFFESLIDVFLAVGLKDFKARYIETSAGGKSVWTYKDGQEYSDDLELTDKHVVFSGKMEEGTREEMEEMAEDFGAIVQKAVNGKTEILVIGAAVGQKKLQKAKDLGVTIITEEEFMDLIEYGDC